MYTEYRHRRSLYISMSKETLADTDESLCYVMEQNRIIWGSSSHDVASLVWRTTHQLFLFALMQSGGSPSNHHTVLLEKDTQQKHEFQPLNKREGERVRFPSKLLFIPGDCDDDDAATTITARHPPNMNSWHGLNLRISCDKKGLY